MMPDGLSSLEHPSNAASSLFNCSTVCAFAADRAEFLETLFVTETDLVVLVKSPSDATDLPRFGVSSLVAYPKMAV